MDQFICMFLHISFCENIVNGKVAIRCVILCMYNVETLLEFQTVRITVLHINKLFRTDMCYARALFKSFYMLEKWGEIQITFCRFSSLEKYDFLK